MLDQSPSTSIPVVNSKRIAPVSRGSAAYPRKRAVTACQVCRARRTKCDQKKPACSFCESIGATCVVDPATLSAFDPASLAILERLSGLEDKLDTFLQSPNSRIAQPADGLDGQAEIPNILTTDAKNLLPSNLEAISKWPNFRCLALPLPLSPHLTGSLTLSRSSGRTVAEELDPILCNRLLDSFFSHVHVKNPILDERQIRSLVRKICLEGAGWDAESCLVLLICANGALTRSFSAPSLTLSEVENSLATGLFLSAQKRLGSVLGSPGILNAQCAFFAAVFLMSSFRPFDAWRMFLQALAISQSFHFIRQPVPVGSPRVSTAESAAEESVYWSSWKSERELRWELGLADFDSLTLSPPQLFPSLPDDCKDESLRAWYFYLSEISIWRLETQARNEITQLVKERSKTFLESLLELGNNYEERIIAWQDSLPSSVSITVPEASAQEGDVLRFVLKGRTTYMHELLWWPFIYAVLCEGEETHKYQQAAARGLVYHEERLQINRPGFFHRHHGTWLMLQTSSRSACILLAFAQTPTLSRLLPQNWRGAVEDAIALLDFWQGDVEGMSITADILRKLLANAA